MDPFGKDCYNGIKMNSTITKLSSRSKVVSHSNRAIAPIITEMKGMERCLMKQF